MSDDYIEGDPFDPEVVVKQEDLAYEEAVDVSEETMNAIRRRQSAYANVFSEGETSKDDLEFVMKDLAIFSRAYGNTFHKDNQKIQDLLEGRKEVFYRIMDATRLSHETLYIKYTDALNKGTKQ